MSTSTPPLTSNSKPTVSQETRSYCTEDRACSGMKQLLVLTLLTALGSSQFVFFGPRFGGQQLGRQPGQQRPVQSFTPAPQPTVSRPTVDKIYHTVNRLRSFLSSCHHVIMSSCHHVIMSLHCVIASSCHTALHCPYHPVIINFQHCH